MPLEPYTATICGKERQVRGWNDAGDRLLLTEGEGFTFEPLAKQKDDFCCRRLLAVAILESTPDGWLLDGQPLSEVETPSAEIKVWNGEMSAREFGLVVLRSELDQLDGVVHGVAWFARRDGNEGWDEPLLLRSFRAVPGEGVVTVPGQFREEKPSGEALGADVLPPKRDFQRLKLGNGKTVRPPKAAREVLVALDTLGQRNVACAAIKQAVARMRGSKNTETPSDSYSPLKALRGSSVGRQILHPKYGVVTYRREHRQQLTLCTLRVL